VRKAAFVGALLLLVMFTAGTVSMTDSEPGDGCSTKALSATPRVNIVDGVA